MPIIAVLPAVMAVGFTAAGAATGALIGTTLAFAVVGAVGATLGAVGAVTKNKTLGYIGMGLGAIGAVGGLASAAGVFAEGGMFGSAASGASGAAETIATDTPWALPGDAVTTSMQMPANAAANAAATEAAYTAPWNVPSVPAPGGLDISQNFQGTPRDVTSLETTMQPEPTATATGEATTSGKILPDGTTAPGSAETTPGGGAASGTADPWQMAEAPKSPTATPATSDTNFLGAAKPDSNYNMSGQLVGSKDASGSVVQGDRSWLQRNVYDTFNDVADWAEKHKVLSQGMMTTASALIAGLKPTTTEAQANSLNAAAAANNALAKMREQQMANISAPRAVAYSAPVSGAPARDAWGFASPGLINRAPTANVTGATA